MIIVVAEIQLKPGTKDDFLDEFRNILTDVRSEHGCIEYGPTVDAELDLEVVKPVRPDMVTVIEKWRNPDALADHLVAPHMLAYRKRVKPYVDNVRLRVLTPAEFPN